MSNPPVIHDHAFSPAVLATTVIPAFNRAALPYLLRDRKECVEGGMRYNPETKADEHNGEGIDHARDMLKRIENRLQGDVSDNLRAILNVQLVQQRRSVQFWEGKLWMLDQMIRLAKEDSS